MAETETDSILDDVRAAATEIETGAPPAAPPEVPVEPPAGETAEQKADRIRDEQGRFAKAEDRPRETLKLKEKPEAEAKVPDRVPVGEQPKPPAEQPRPGEEPIAPPAEWKGAGKVQWNKLPKAIQAELRETYEGLATTRAQFAPLEQAIAPHRDVLVRDAGSVESGIGQLMTFYRAYLDNPVGLIQHIARTRGIDLGAPQGQQPQGGTPQVAPDINSIVAQTVQQKMQEHQRQTAIQQKIGEISAFQADPAHPYFNDVVNEIEGLVAAANQRGTPITLQQAYEQATWANPVIRQQLLTAQSEEAKQANATAAEKARKAVSASLRGSPLPNGSGATGSGATVLDDVRAAAAEIAGA